VLPVTDLIDRSENRWLDHVNKLRSVRSARRSNSDVFEASTSAIYQGQQQRREETGTEGYSKKRTRPKKKGPTSRVRSPNAGGATDINETKKRSPAMPTRATATTYRRKTRTTSVLLATAREQSQPRALECSSTPRDRDFSWFLTPENHVHLSGVPQIHGHEPVTVGVKRLGANCRMQSQRVWRLSWSSGPGHHWFRPPRVSDVTP
jgi:hypothetical protein